MYFTNSLPQTGDILIAEDHPVNGAFPWTQQSMGCGRPGEFVYLPYSFIAPSNSSQVILYKYLVLYVCHFLE